MHLIFIAADCKDATIVQKQSYQSKISEKLLSFKNSKT